MSVNNKDIIKMYLSLLVLSRFFSNSGKVMHVSWTYKGAGRFKYSADTFGICQIANKVDTIQGLPQ